MSGRVIAAFLAGLALLLREPAHGQQVATYRVGVIHVGGVFQEAVEGLKDGLKELGLSEGKHYVLEVRDLKGDPQAVAAAAKRLEAGKIDVLYVLGTSVTTVVKRATTAVPIVFAVAADPVNAGLINGFARPGGRLTGVHFLGADLTAKRLEILRETLPRLRRVATFHDPGNPTAAAAAKLAREAGRSLKVDVVERRVTSVEELRIAVQALKPEDADAYFHVNDAMVLSQAQFIIDTAIAKKLPTMFAQPTLVAKGALISYGVSYDEIGRLSAKYVQRVLAGTPPRDLPVESLGTVGLAVNLKTARVIGVTIPQAVRLRAREVVE